MKKIWIIAGESSGDLYGARLGAKLREIAAEAGEELQLSGMGGVNMINAGIDVMIDSSELGVVGFFEVFKQIFTFIRIFRFLLKKAQAERPDAVVMIDYPGFNLRLAKKLHALGIKVVWYISPHVWVWGKHRVKTLTQICSEMLVIFPFEVDFYADKGYTAKFVGHPLVDIVNERRKRDGEFDRDPHELLLLPGSRHSEVSRLLPAMLRAIPRIRVAHPELRFHLAAPREKVAAECREIIAGFTRRHPDLPEIELSVGDTSYHLRKAIAGIAASGTVTVEAALSGLPLVGGYKLNYFTLLLAGIFVHLYRGFFIMPNIILNKEVYRELLQWRFSPKNIAAELEKILPGGSRRAEVESDLAQLTKQLSAHDGDAARQTAQICWECAHRQ